MSEHTAITFSPVIPFHGDVKSFAMLGPFQGPMEFDGWRQESLSWKNTAYLGAALALSRQKEIRATVARFPYLQVERNDKVDVETIPRPPATKV
jgi:hypothetical protein